MTSVLAKKYYSFTVEIDAYDTFFSGTFFATFFIIFAVIFFMIIFFSLAMLYMNYYLHVLIESVCVGIMTVVVGYLVT